MPGSAAEPPAVRFATSASVFAAVGGARDVALSAYVLAPRGPMVRALEAAADHGARVAVTLEDFADRGPGDPLRRSAASAAAELREHGVDVRAGARAGETVHLKAAVVDGTAYLDDRNWATGGATVVATTRPDQVAAIRDAVRCGAADGTADLGVEKDAALRLERAAILAGSGDRVDCESESFGACGVSAALRARAQAGAHVRLLVNARIAFEPGADRERAVLHGLAAAGVEIRTTPAAEKLCVAGDRGWAGSANATFDRAPTADWGLALDAPAAVATLEATFAAGWSSATPFR